MHGAGDSEEPDELEHEADDQVPQVTRNLRASNQNSPQNNKQHCVERVADIPQSEINTN